MRSFAASFALGLGLISVSLARAEEAVAVSRLGVELQALPDSKPEARQGISMDGPKVVIVRLQRHSLSGGARACEAWKRSTFSVPDRGNIPTPAWEGWGTLNSGELKMIQECTSVPCDVKLDEDEALRMAGAQKDKRLARYFELLQARLDEFRKSGKRRGAEFPGPILDPAQELRSRGASLPPAVGTASSESGWKVVEEVRLRTLPFDSGEPKTVRQIVQFQRGERALDAYVLARDLYTNHYFDAWGEFLDLRCLSEADGKDPSSVEVLFALVIDFDVLKSTDLFSRLGRPKLRSALEKEGYRYLATLATALEKKAIENLELPVPEAPAPTPTPTPSASPSPSPVATPSGKSAG